MSIEMHDPDDSRAPQASDPHAASRTDASGIDASNADDSEPLTQRGSRVWLVLRFLLGLGLLVGVVILLVRTLRPELESVGTWFVSRFGLAGVAAGTFIADGFHFPVPPQFYMLLATAAHADPTAVVAATSLGSVLGGTAGYCVARQLGHIRALSRWLERFTGKAKDLVGRRYPYRSAVAASLSPMAFSVLCYLAGLLRVKRGPVLVLLVLRIPKIVLYYYLVRVGWGFS